MDLDLGSSGSRTALLDSATEIGFRRQSVDFVKMSFAEVGIEIAFRGKGADEKGYVVSCSDPEYQLEKGSEVVAIDTQYYRPTEVDLLVGDASKAKTKLGWQPRHDLGMLVKEMMASDVEIFKKEKILKDKGYSLKKHFE